MDLGCYYVDVIRISPRVANTTVSLADARGRAAGRPAADGRIVQCQLSALPPAWSRLRQPIWQRS
jgi:hypothetical protein